MDCGSWPGFRVWNEVRIRIGVGIWTRMGLGLWFGLELRLGL